MISFDISVDLLQDLTGDMHLLRGGLDKARINTNTAGMAPMGDSGPVPTGSAARIKARCCLTPFTWLRMKS